jgi:cyclopropane fatty-acyl-phospholipid synthase-like methyltransferase
MYNKPLKRLPRILYRLTGKVLLRSYPNYQPIIKKGEIIPGADRNCLDRWNLIKNEIKNFSAASLVDLGCAEGFYVLQAARECHCLSLGVDADIRRLIIANHQLIEEKVQPAGFLLAEINQKFLEKLPTFDIVVFMSVMHHIMAESGEEYSRRLLEAMKRLAGKALIFEMGQSDETKNKWAKKLPDMGADPHSWIKKFILSAGYSKVIQIGMSDSYQKDQSRAIFKALP